MNARTLFTCLRVKSWATTSFLLSIAACLAPTVEAAAPRAECPATRVSELTVTEIMYNPLDPLDEFIEIYNTSPVDKNIGGYQLKGQIDYTFPANTMLNGNSYMVIAKTPANYANAQGPYLGALSNDGGAIKLYSPHGVLHCDVNYNDSYLWPTSADGFGHSIAMAKPDYGESNPLAWTASASIGGSPNSIDTPFSDPASYVKINEIFIDDTLKAVTVEFLNAGPSAVNIQNYEVINDADQRYTVPALTLSANAHTTLRIPITSTFTMPLTGGSIALENAAGTRVIDAIAYSALPDQTSFGRFPDGATYLTELASSSLGQPNRAENAGDIVINEIMYNPITDNNDDEYIELHNRSLHTVDLSGWKISGEVSYTIPAGTSLQAGAYLIIANDDDALIAKYTPKLSAANTLGGFSGNLSNSEGILYVKQPLYTDAGKTYYRTVDIVPYKEFWGHLSDGGGSSLELLDPHSNNALGSNWADSDESEKAPWTTINETATLFDGDSSGSTDLVDSNDYEFHIQMMDAGECLIDDVQVKINGSDQITNTTFDNNLDGWKYGYNFHDTDTPPNGNHMESFHDTNGGYNQSGALHIVADSAGESSVNHIEYNIPADLKDNDTAIITAKARWVKGSNQLMTRLRGGYMDVITKLTLPDYLGSPGEQNPVNIAQANSGPAIENISHYPIFPATGESVTITATVTDNDSIKNNGVVIKYHKDLSSRFYDIVMHDDGLNGDLQANDGVYVGTIPPQAERFSLLFRIEAADVHDNLSYGPHPSLNEALIRWSDPITSHNIDDLRIWLVDSVRASLNKNANPAASDRLHPCTLVYNGYRVIYNAGIRHRGSPFTRGSPFSINYKIKIKEGEPLLSDRNMSLDGRHKQVVGQENRIIDEWMLFWIAEQMGIEVPHKRWQHVYVDGIKNQSMLIHADLSRPNSTYLKSRSPKDTDGDLHYIDLRMDRDDNGYGEGVGGAPSVGLVSEKHPTTGLLHAPLYHMVTAKKMGDTTDYTSLFHLINTLYSSSSTDQDLIDLIDADQLMGAMAIRYLSADQDGWGSTYDLAKNAFIYKPTKGKWKHYLWDIDNQVFTTTTAALDPNFNNAPGIKKLYAIPEFKRAYWRMLEAVADDSGPMNNFTTVAAQRKAMFTADSITCDITGVNSFIPARKTRINSTVSGKNFASSFSITGQTVSGRELALSGKAPLSVKTIKINGRTIPIVWTDTDEWAVDIALQLGANTLEIRAYNDAGVEVSGSPVSLNKTGTGTATPNGISLLPAAGNIVISELMYNPQADDPVTPTFDNDEYEFIELYNKSSENIFLGDLSFSNGISFAFADDIELGAGDYAVLVKNQDAFIARYGTGPTIIGTYPNSKLSNGGETITLVDSTGNVVSSVDYNDAAPWAIQADGYGPSLELVNPNANDLNASAWRADSLEGTPGGPYVTSPIIPVQISEILSHTDVPYTDTVELYNPSSSSVDIGGWFLSDSSNNPKLFKIKAGTTIPGHGYLKIKEDNDSNLTNPVSDDTAYFGDAFKLSSHGDNISLSSADGNGNLTGYVTVADFGASANGVSFGRVETTDAVYYPAQTSLTLGNVNDASLTAGLANAGPKIGPLVITEIMASPQTGKYAFVEIVNISAGSVNLYDDTNTPGKSNPLNTYQVKGIGFNFPTYTTMAAGEAVLITDAPDEASFRTAYPNTPAGMQIFSYTGSLDLQGEKIKIRYPDAEDTDPVTQKVTVPMITMDEVNYGSSSAWPTFSIGKSIIRDTLKYGNEPTNWTVSALDGTPGTYVGGSGNAIPNAVITVNKTTGDAPLTVTFSASNSSDSDGNIVSWVWDFDNDGTQDATGENPPAHTYTASGSYIAKLTVTDNQGAFRDEIVTIYAIPNALPVPTIHADVTTGVAPLAVTFSSTGSYDPNGSITGWAWDFDGNGSTDSTDENPSPYSYPNKGVYNAKLTVTDNLGGVASSTLQITVDPVVQPITFIEVGDTWNYLTGNNDPGSSWMNLVYDDSSWLSGASGFGYADGDDTTILTMSGIYSTLFLRKTFVVTNPSKISDLLLWVDYDDGYEAYLNGTKVASANAPANLTHTSEATGIHHPSIENRSSDGEPDQIFIDNSLLVSGTNILTIVGLNDSITSSDFTMIPKLSAMEEIGGDPLLSDPDGDGLNDFLEEAFGLNPNLKDAPTLNQIYSRAANGDVTYNVRNVHADYSYVVQTSPDLVNWTDHTTLTSTGGPTPVNIASGTAVNGKLFIRLKVTK